MNTSFYTLLLSLLLVISIGGCSRLEVPATKFTFFIPQQKTLSSKSTQSTLGTLQHVIINVRGPGIAAPISMTYDANSHDSSAPQELPSIYTLEIPSGSSRLIQILAVYSQENSKNSAFFYGDSTVNLNGGEVAVDIPMSLRGSGSTQSGRIAGRYFSSDGSTPSGVIESQFSPATDKPPMIITKSSMTAGWFTAFALEDIPMDIVLSGTGQKIFERVELNSLTFSNNKAMKVTAPPLYQSFGGTYGQEREGTSVAMGFFGPGIPSGHKICYTHANHTYTNLYVDSTRTTKVEWDAASTRAGNVTATKHATITTCSPTDLALAFNSVYTFDPRVFDKWSGDSGLSGIFGIFKIPGYESQMGIPVSVSFDRSGQFTSQFSLLPGISNSYDAIGIYYRALNSPRDYERGEEYPCTAIATGGYGFRQIGTIPLIAGTSEYSVAKASPSDISMNSAFAFCPLKNGVAFGGGFINSHPWDLSAGGGGGMGPSVEANSFQPHMMNQIGTNQCHRLDIQLVNETSGTFNFNVVNSNPRSFSLTNNMGLSFFENESSCLNGSPTITSLFIPANTISREVWIQSGPDYKVGQVTIESLSSFGAPVSRSLPLNIVEPSPPTQVQAMRDRIYLAPNGCEIIELTAYDSSFTPSPFSGEEAIPLYKGDLSESVIDGSFDFYANCSSTTAIGSAVFNPGTFKTTFAVKANGTASSDRRIFTSTYGAINIYLNIIPQAEYVSVEVNNAQPVYEGMCVPMKVEAKDNAGNIVRGTNFQFDIRANHPTSTGYYGKLVYTCGSYHSPSAPFYLSDGENNHLFYHAENDVSGLQFETRSIMAHQVRQTPLNILAVPQFARTDSAKVHLTSDVVHANYSSISSWPVPIPGGLIFAPTSSINDVSAGANPKADGVIFNSTLSKIEGPITVSANYNMAITARFKITTAGDATILSLRSTTTTVGDNQDFKIYTEVVSGSLILKGTGGWEYAETLNLNTWYTVTLTREDANVAGFINGTPAGTTSTFIPTQGSYDQFEIGTGFVGALKAVIIDAASTGAVGIGTTDHNYLLQRVP